MEPDVERLDDYMLRNYAGWARYRVIALTAIARALLKPPAEAYDVFVEELDMEDEEIAATGLPLPEIYTGR